MCASYGFDGPLSDLGLTFDLAPMHEPDSRALVAEWRRSQRGKARITGPKALNLNPIIHEGYGERRAELAWWWLHAGAEPAPFSAFNSRDDRLLHSWREPFQRRAILPADWYVEKGVSFALPDDEPFGIAAIVTPVARPGSMPMLSYSMVTRAAVGRAVDTHPRMPMLLPREFHGDWLDPGRSGDSELITAAVRASEHLGSSVIARGPVASTRGEGEPGTGAPGPGAPDTDTPTLF